MFDFEMELSEFFVFLFKMIY